MSKPKRRCDKNRNKRLRMWNEQNGACIYCGQLMWVNGVHPIRKLNKMATIEHIIPPKLGGSNTHNSNLACSCAHCNRSRGQIDHYEFFQIRKHSNWQVLAREAKWKIGGIYEEQITKRLKKRNIIIHWKNKRSLNILRNCLTKFRSIVYV